MNLLAIETSSPSLSVAIKKRGAKLRHATVKGYMKHAENLLPVIDRLLRKERLKLRDIAAFLIARGPGSFTGLRIGFATLKGFLALLPTPCYGAYSLDVIAAGIPASKSHEALTVCLDARRGKLYTRSYGFPQRGLAPRGPACVLSFAEMLQKLPADSLIAGDGVPKIDASGLTVLPEKSWAPQAATLIELFETKSPLLKKLTSPRSLLPFYLRSSEAEERLRERK